MKSYPPTYGQTSNRIPYVTFGEGTKTLLLLYGGPGNILPKGFTYATQVKDFFPLCKTYTIYLLMRKMGLSHGDTTETMAKHYAEMITRDFGGHVDAIIGYSYGGLIAQHFAADYPEFCQKIIFLSSTNENSAKGKEIDTKFAEYLSQRKKGKAFALMMDVIMNPGIVRSITKFLMRCIGPLIPVADYPEFSADVMIELEAELKHDAQAKLSKIPHSVLILLGDEDYYFSIESAEQMKAQIPHAKFVKLEKIGHEITHHPRFLEEVVKYLEISI